MREKIKVELHVHTQYSKDSYLDKYFLLMMCKFKNIKCIAITDHNEILGAIEFKKFLGVYGIKVIIGEEIFTTKGEVIGLFLHKKISPQMAPLDTLLEIKRQNGIVYIPHPYDEKRFKSVLSKEEILNNKALIDIVEVHNGRNVKADFSEKQNEIADCISKIKISGSDAHCFIEIGRNYIIMDSFESKVEFLENLKNATLIKKDCLKFIHFITLLIRTSKMVLKGDFHEIYRAINKKFKRN